MRDFISTTLFVLALAVLEAAVGPRATRLGTFLAFCILVPLAIDLGRAAWARTGASRRRVAVEALLPATALLALGQGESGATPFLAIAGAWACLARVQARTDSRFGTAATAALASFGYGVFALVRDHLTLWPLLVPLSNVASTAIAGLFGVERRFGPTYSGLWLVALVIAVIAARAILARGVRPSRLATALVLLVAVVAGWYACGRIPAPHAHAVSPVDVLGLRVTLFALLLLPLGHFVATHPASVVRALNVPSAGRRRFIVPAAMLLVVAGCLALAFATPIRPGPVRLLVDARGAFSMQPIQWGRYGPDVAQGASLANLPAVVAAHGWTSTVHEAALDSTVLAAHDVLLVMNPTTDFDSTEHAAVWRWVEGGGGLLVLGDHTNIQETMPPLNRLLAPCGIEVAFDSAIPVAERWTWYSCMRFHPHPVMRGARDESDIKISVGASLVLPHDALPLVTGRDGFADAGDWENAAGAYLGNMRYDRNEPMGDLPLAAAIEHGRGRVVVFGDTSPFQRTAVAFTYPFVARVLAYLGGDASGGAPRTARVAGAVAVTLGAVLLAFAGATGLPALAIASAAAACVLTAIDRAGTVRLPEEPLRGDVAYVDLAHGNRVDLHSGREEGIAGLFDHLWRADFVPLAMRAWDERALAGAQIFVTVAPAFEFAPGERRALRRFVEAGGTLVVASGFEERRGALSLLAEFGYAIGRTPIGAAHVAVTHLPGEHAMMHEAWPVERPAGRGEVWVEAWDYPLVVFERIGDGNVLVIGDSKFLCDVKLESPERAVEPNIDFLRRAWAVARNREIGGRP